MNNLLANLHHTLQGHDLGEDGAEILTKSLLQRIEDTAERFQLHSTDWEHDMLGALRLCQGVKKGADSATTYLLAILRERWDELSIEFRKSYDYQFDVLVLRETGVVPTTMDNYIRAAKTFFVERKCPAFQVEVTVYDEYRRPLKKDGEVVKKRIDFDPGNVPITKLTLMRPLVEHDKMTPELWSMLADPEITVDALSSKIYKRGENGGDKRDLSLRFTLNGVSLVAHEFGEEVEVGEIFFENGDSELGRTAIRRMLMILGIPYEEDLLAKMIQSARENRLIRIYETGGKELIINGDYTDS